MIDFAPTKKQLSTLHDPKSIKSYIEVFQSSSDDENLFRYLNTDGINGLDSDAIDRSIEKYGENKLPEHIPKTFMKLVFEALNDNTMLLLSAAAVVSFLLGLYELYFQPAQFDPEGNEITKVDWIEGVAIMIAVVVVVLVSAVNDYQKELQFQRLSDKKEKDKKCVVLRDNSTAKLIPNTNLVVGDLIKLQTGDIVAADCILIAGECESDESNVTGESDTIRKIPLSNSLAYITKSTDKNLDITNDKHLPDCMIISGSKIISGFGKAIITAVGVNSVHGRTMASLIDGHVKTDDEDINGEEDVEDNAMTPLQERLCILTDKISVYGCVAATFLFTVLFLKFLYNVFSPNGNFQDLTPAEKGNKFLNIFITAITIIVVAVPEGLPLAVTLALAFATTRMTKDGNLVRVLKACETMGSATTICSDKTGTLTKNVMTVVKAIIGGSSIERVEELSEEMKKDILANIVLNSTAFENKDYEDVHQSENPFAERTQAQNSKSAEPFIGSKTETALLALSKKSLDLDSIGVLQNVRNDPSSKFSDIEKVVQIIPFESSRKWSGIVVKLKDSKTYRFYIKGAAELVVKGCSHQRMGDNSIQFIDIDNSEKITETIRTFATGALRAISLAHKDFKNHSNWPPAKFVNKKSSQTDPGASPGLLFGNPLDHSKDTDNNGLTLDGIFGIMDPLRDDVANSVTDLDSIGVLQNVRNDPSSKFSDIEKVVQIIPFESSRKWSGIVVKLKDSKTYRFYIKGAAELVVKGCSHQRMGDNSIQFIDIDNSEKITETIRTFATGALRAISLAHKDFKNHSNWPPAKFVNKKSSQTDPGASPGLLFGNPLDHSKDTDNNGLTLDGIFGIMDPLRDDVANSVTDCQNAGVTVRMLTGDNLITAKAIAKNCNILSEKTIDLPGSAMEGPNFRELNKDERVKILPNLKVLARSSPEDKRLLVETLKSMGDVVAATGDGTNDAPALKLADVGFSMGISGTEVAREASDIILMTDDFSSIINAIKWGRCVSISIKKFIQFQLTVNITAVILTFVSAVISVDETSVLTAVQLLWVNLIMDTLAALALATDKPDPNILKKKPMGRCEPLISFSTWKMIISQSTLQLITTFILHLCGAKIFFSDKMELTGKEQQQLDALTFNTFVWLQFFTLIVSRKLDEGDGISTWKGRFTQSNLNFFQDLFRNGYFLCIMAIIGIFQVIIMNFGGIAFSIERQTSNMWIVAICCGMLSLPLGLLVRWCPDEFIKKVFSDKLFGKLKYILTFGFIKSCRDKNKSEDEESLLERDGTSPLYGSNNN